MTTLTNLKDSNEKKIRNQRYVPRDLFQRNFRPNNDFFFKV